jgi:hypothetical protein
VLASALRAIGAKYRHLWPAIMKQPAAPGSVRHRHTRRKGEHPGCIPPAAPGRHAGRGKQAPRPRPSPLTPKHQRHCSGRNPEQIVSPPGWQSWMSGICVPGCLGFPKHDGQCPECRFRALARLLLQFLAPGVSRLRALRGQCFPCCPAAPLPIPGRGCPGGPKS